MYVAPPAAAILSLPGVGGVRQGLVDEGVQRLDAGVQAFNILIEHQRQAVLPPYNCAT